MHKLCNKAWYNKQTIIQLLPHSSLSKFISSNKNASKLKRGCLVSVLLEQMWKGILSHTHTPTSIVSAQDTQFLEIYTFLVPWIIWYYLNTGKWLILLTPCWKTAKHFTSLFQTAFINTTQATATVNGQALLLTQRQTGNTTAVLSIVAAKSPRAARSHGSQGYGTIVDADAPATRHAWHRD